VHLRDGVGALLHPFELRGQAVFEEHAQVLGGELRDAVRGERSRRLILVGGSVRASP
jgi:hypothetical protein